MKLSTYFNKYSIYRIWHVETFDCIRILQGHDLKVRCLRFDSSYIVSGSYDGTIKIWDLKAALNASSSNDQLCLTTMEVGLQFNILTKIH